MAGYSGYSMSNNAVTAYGNGEKPRSRWSKADMLSEVSAQMTGGEDFTIEDLKRLTVTELRGLCLEYSSWHHTSSMFNRTDFFRVDISPVNLETISTIISNRTAHDQKNTPPYQKCRVSFGQWEGTRKHPRLKWYESYAVIHGKWVYLPDGQRIRTDRAHLTIIETYSRSPRGTADTFGQIEKHMQKGTK